MYTLIPFAEELAKNPPVNVYKFIMAWYANEVKKVENDDYGLANVWNDMVDRYTLDGAMYSLGAICDFTAMCMMMAAAGVARVEQMKGAIRSAVKDKKKGQVLEDKKSGDSAWIFEGKGDTASLEKLLDGWCDLKGNGVVQFKFGAEGDWHTFAVERAQEGKDDPVFVVYQSYQNLYRLKDFLGMGAEKDQVAQMKRAWEYLNETQQSKYKGGLKEFTQKALERIEYTATSLGKKKLLSRAALEMWVIAPLSRMLAGALANEDYAAMTASASSLEQLRADSMAVMMCNQVSPADFKPNYLRLCAPDKALTMYPDCFQVA